MKLTGFQKSQNIVYGVAWALIIAVYTMSTMRERSVMGDHVADMHMFMHMSSIILPYILLFMVNNGVLIPRLLMRERYGHYCAAACLIVLVVWSFQVTRFVYFESHMPGPRRGPHPDGVPLPVILDLTYDLFTIGGNLAIALLFQRYADTLERARQLKSEAETRLQYLKAQINPHFYMNMLNNIHGMIEINPEKAQDMVLNMSQLMRYMLYESSKKRIALGMEVDFVRNYLKIMRARYPDDKVRITASLPDNASGVSVPPLLFLVYIENAFKHGISYCDNSWVDVCVRVEDHKVVFECSNSCHQPSTGVSTGIGLANACQRLHLIYGDDFDLDTRVGATAYSVILSIPAYEDNNY